MGTQATLISDARVVCARCTVANSPWRRLRGLMGRRSLDAGEGLLLRPSSSVHTCFMRFPIDIVFLDRDLTVLDIAPAVRPWRARGKRGARAVLELGAGEADRLAIRAGEQFTLDHAETDRKEEVHVHAVC